MTYRVILQRLAREDLRAVYRWVAARAPVQALRWLERFERALQTLDQRPERCRLARESGKVSVELREFLFGRRPYVYRVLFFIDGDAVRILRIRRAQRRFMTAAELRDALSDLP